MNQPTATIMPTQNSPTQTSAPFEMFGQTLTNQPYCTATTPAQVLDLYFPSSDGPWPAAVYVHGGSWMHGDKSEALMFAHQMTAQGFLVVSINYRLYPSGTFPAMIQDVKCAIRFLRANAVQFNLDPERIGAIGPSAGGHLVSLLGTSDAASGWDVGEYPEHSSRVQAVIAMAAVTDLTRPFPNADIETMKLIGFGEHNVLQASPVNHVTSDDPPFLLIHGDRDDVVPVEQSQLMYDRLVQANVPAQLVIVQNANHSFVAPGGSTTPSMAEVGQMIQDFLLQHLK
jgi:acetyl esterase/lipase